MGPLKLIPAAMLALLLMGLISNAIHTEWSWLGVLWLTSTLYWLGYNPPRDGK